MGNASTFSFPVRYQEARGASIDRLLNQCDPKLLEPFIIAAKQLESRGVKAITGACGFLPDGLPMAVGEMEEQTEFREAVLEEKGTSDSDKIEQKVIGVAKQLVKRDPQIGAFLLECSNLPPYAKAVQQALSSAHYGFLLEIKKKLSTPIPNNKIEIGSSMGLSFRLCPVV